MARRRRAGRAGFYGASTIRTAARRGPHDIRWACTPASPCRRRSAGDPHGPARGSGTFPIFLPFFLVRDLDAVNDRTTSRARHLDLPGCSDPSYAPSPGAGPALQVPTLWQSLEIEGQSLLGRRDRAYRAVVGHGPLWITSPPGPTKTRHGSRSALGVCAPSLAVEAENAVAHASTATRRVGTLHCALDIEFPPSGSQLSRSLRLQLIWPPVNTAPAARNAHFCTANLRRHSFEDRAGGQRGGSVVSPVVSGNTSTQMCRRLPR